MSAADPSRRRFLAASASLAGAAAAASAMPGWAAAAQPRRIPVDWHSHYVGESELRFLARRRKAPMLVPGPDGRQLFLNADTASAAAGPAREYTPSDIAARLRHLDEHGIERQLLTHTVAMGYDHSVPVDELRVFYREFNDEMARIVAAHPARFLAVAALPAADPVWAAEELARTKREYGFIGGSLPLNAFITLRSAQTLKPLFEQGQKLGSHIFLHRASASPALPDQPPVEIPADTDWARWTLINNAHLASAGITLGLTDFLAPYPDVTVEIIMLAGFLPYILDTWVAAGRDAGIADPLARLRRVYYDTGPYAARNAEWVAQAVRKIGADRILFGTDYGVYGGANGNVAPALAALDRVLSPYEKQVIFVDNSRALLKRLGIS